MGTFITHHGHDSVCHYYSYFPADMIVGILQKACSSGIEILQVTPLAIELHTHQGVCYTWGTSSVAEIWLYFHLSCIQNMLNFGGKGNWYEHPLCVYHIYMYATFSMSVSVFPVGMCLVTSCVPTYLSYIFVVLG